MNKYRFYTLSLFILLYTHVSKVNFDVWSLLQCDKAVYSPRMLWTYAPDKLFCTFFLTSKFFFWTREKNYEWFVFKQTFSPHYIRHIIFLFKQACFCCFARCCSYLNKVSDQISIRILYFLKGLCVDVECLRNKFFIIFSIVFIT